MAHGRKTRRGILAVLTAVLLAAAICTFPYAFGETWSLPGAEADRTLTYTTGKLTWDSAADIDANGEIILSMFKSAYTNVESADGSKVVAPGTDNTTCIRLRNKAGSSISYTAVLYRLDETEVPIVADLSGAAAVKTYSLPKNVSEDQVVKAIGGTVKRNSVQLLDIDWLWQYFVDDEGDELDTHLGNAETPEQVRYGLYIVVTDNSTGQAVNPKTGDSSHIVLWSVLTLVSLCAVVYLLASGERSRKSRQEHAG